MTIASTDIDYTAPGPSRAEIDAMPGALVVDFGTDWCGHCRAARVPVATAFADHPGIGHVRIEDGPGRRTGRSFGVKLWPTLVFLFDGRELARVVRPTEPGPVAAALAVLAAAVRTGA